jgi:DNA-binding CsgD family transcriptional regulator
VPGTVPRGSRHSTPGNVFSPLGRAILDRLDRGIVLMDEQGQVVDLNALAARLIRTCDGISLRSGRLAFADVRLNDRLLQAITSHKAGVPDGRAVIGARIRCKDGDPYRILVVPVLADIDERDVAFFVLLYPPNGQIGISSDVLREVYGLTRAQADVARSLFGGLSAEQTARALGLSVNTVRSHLKQIFTRCEVSSQAELMHLLALGPHEL